MTDNPHSSAHLQFSGRSAEHSPAARADSTAAVHGTHCDGGGGGTVAPSRRRPVLLPLLLLLPDPSR
jgi:hypothetical protein